MAISNDNPRTTLLNWRWRVGCKRSSPNGENVPPVRKRYREEALPVKKRKYVLAGREQMEAQLYLSHQHRQKKEEIPDWEEPKNEATAGNALSTEGGNSYLSDSPQCSTNETHLSVKGDEHYLPDSPQYITSRIQFSAEGSDSFLPGSPWYNTNGTHFSAEGGNSYLSDSGHYNTIGTQFSAEGGDSYLSDAHPEYNSDGTQFSAERDDSYLSVLSQNNKGGDSYLPDSRPQDNTVEGSTKNEEASNAKSMLDKWACCDCKAAAVPVAAFPCCHICPCWNCDFEMDSCPICGEARTDGGKFSAKVGDSHLSDLLPRYNATGTHFSAEGGYSYLLDSRLLYDTDGTRLSAEGDDSYLPDSHLQYSTAEGSTKNEEASNAESVVDKGACRDRKAAALSIATFPFCHFCPSFWDCSALDSCSICGKARSDG